MWIYVSENVIAALGFCAPLAVSLAFLALLYFMTRRKDNDYDR